MSRALYLVPIEVLCHDCGGCGLVGMSSEWTCSNCDGEGYTQKKVTLIELKDLLEGKGNG